MITLALSTLVGGILGFFLVLLFGRRSIWLVPPAVAYLYFLNACAPAASEPDPAPDFLGKWADASAPPFLFTVEFRPDRSVTFQVRNGGELISQSDGEWSYRAPLLITRDKTCQEGPPLRLVVCEAEPDTVRPAVSGDSWPLTFQDGGELISFHLRRVN